MLLYNSRDKNFKSPFGAVANSQKITINFPIATEIKADTVYMIIRGQRDYKLALSFDNKKNDYNYYTITFSLDDVGIYYYRFEIETTDGITFVGRDKSGKAIIKDWAPEWQLTIYSADYKIPQWVKGGLIYHIFVDRFARVADNKRPTYGILKDWNDEITIVDSDGVYRANDFYGGNIKGIITKLDYLKSLGISILYLSPIFASSSNHRYDTADYMSIDPLLGTEDDFKELIKCADNLGIGIILDGVFNHTGADSIYFNKFNHYQSLGAYQSKLSKYYDWFSFTKYPDVYDCWWGVTVVPTVARHCIDFQKFITAKNGVIDHWTSLGVKGWRLDVVDELSSAFVTKIRSCIKNSDANAVVIGEVWEDASTKVSYSEPREYLLGKQLDGVMNYPFKEAILSYVSNGDAQIFCDNVMDIVENYPEDSLQCSMTLIGSHDTVRAINSLGNTLGLELTKEDKLHFSMSPTQYSMAKKRLKLATCLQYFLDGLPTIYYGDEIGMQGFDDPINRRPYSTIVDTEISYHYQLLGKIRADNRDLFSTRAIVKNRFNLVNIVRGKLTLIVNPHPYSVDLSHTVTNILTNATITKIEPLTAIIISD